jgi:hypothetical protein
VSKIATPEEEEFEYADTTEPDGSVPGPNDPDPGPAKQGWSLADLPEDPEQAAAADAAGAASTEPAEPAESETDQK